MPDEDKNIAPENGSPEEIPSFLRSGDVEDKVDDTVSEVEDSAEVEDVQPVEAEVVESPVEEDVPSNQMDDAHYEELLEESKTSGIWARIDELLVELNLQRKHVFMVGGFFLFLVGGIIVSFFFVFSLFGKEAEEVNLDEPKPVEVVEEVSEENKEGFFSKLFGGKDKNVEEVPAEDGDEEPDSVEEVSTSVTAPKKVGEPFELSIISNSITVTVGFGEAEIADDKLSFYVRSYRKVRNIFNTDLFDFLNGVEDRESAYDTYLIQFKAANEQARLAYNDLLTEITSFDTRLAGLNADVANIENEFFTSLDNLDSEVLPEQLDAFQQFVVKRDVVKSELKARQAIGAKYQKALPVINSKIEAIEANKDAFVKGVKVVDFDQVDLDLIIQAE